jgi:UDP-N-acetylmuramyl tripeptide synthase
VTTLLALACRHGVDALLDDETFSLGTGTGSRNWPLHELPKTDDLPWPEFGNIPIALVTGSNGKTTTVRLLAAMVHASGAVAGYNCTTGVVVDGCCIAQGDYAGPAGSRLVLRDPRVQFAVLETARGGLLRRGLACQRADVAVITNISAEHFGEYGVDTVDDLVEVKAIVARVLGATGVLVLNADDAALMGRLSKFETCRMALFAFDHLHPELVRLRAVGGSTCGVFHGHLHLSCHGEVHDLGAVTAMPLSVGGMARYNVANVAAAALAASHLGLPPGAVAGVLASFGQRRDDNPGRLERWNIHGATVLVDYAHNPAGLEALLTVAQAIPHTGRLGLLLGQAGNRDDGAIKDLARTAARYLPARVLLKDIQGYMRGRQAGEVPALLQYELLASGLAAHQIDTVLSEAAAARALIAWARAGDIIVLPIHESATLADLGNWLDDLQART